VLKNFFHKLFNCEKEKSIEQEKEIEFYSQSVNAWYLSALERDKSILTLSYVGIGFLITLMTNKGIENYYVLLLYALSMFCFIVSIITIIIIFEHNQKYIENIVNKADNSNSKLSYKDKVAFRSFVLGIILMVVVSIVVAIISLNNKKGGTMTESNNTNQQNIVISAESFKNAEKLKESVKDAEKLKPKPSDSSFNANATNNKKSN
jgi:preprotein translocase subunit SecG